MEVKIKIPVGASWPSQYQGQIVVVEICKIKFPDGLYWACEGFAGKVFAEGASSQFFHELPINTKKVSVEYFSPKEMQL